MRLAFLLATIVILAACHPPMETSEKHYVHKGEQAVLQVDGQPAAYIAPQKEDAHAMGRAVDGKNPAELEQLLSAGKLLKLENGTSVKVTEESYNERRIEILEGPFKGKSGWVPFEWLKVPAKKLG